MLNWTMSLGIVWLLASIVTPPTAQAEQADDASASAVSQVADEPELWNNPGSIVEE